NELVGTCADAQEVAKWFVSHTRALALLQNEQIKAGGRARTYALPNLTRWTSHYLSAEGLLEDRGPLQATVALHRDELKHIGSQHPDHTQHVLSTVEQPEFWDNLAKLTTYLRPLAIALNVAQASDTRLDHILISLGNLFKFFDSPDIDPEVRERALGSLKSRWIKADQGPFILAKEPDIGLFEAFVSYYGWEDEFSASAWHLDQYLQMYQREGKPVNLLALWSTLPYPGNTNTGRDQLACLAKLILSVVANSAGAERLFSRMGHIHSKRRNRLHHKKVHNIATVALDLEAQHKAARLTPPAMRSTAEPNDIEPDLPVNSDADIPDSDSEVDLTDEDERVAVDFRALAAKLTKQLDEDADELEDVEGEELPEPSALAAHRSNGRPRVHLFFGTDHPIPLRELFDFSGSIEGVPDGLGVFWKSGIQNLAKEREVYETVASEASYNVADN
ncbi:hypothetical protein FRC10_003306, partial [Ceratobasidium sp. 414]